MRWGAEGQLVQTLFDVVKTDPGIGDTEAFNVVLSGKDSARDIFQDDSGTVDIVAGGLQLPSYVPIPSPHRLGDPPSDPDARTDRDGNNISPPELMRLFYSADALSITKHFWRSTPDRWIAEAAIRILYVEDPDVFYVVMPMCDDAQHVLGAADRPPEWFDPGTPDVLWDDVNIYNPYANRDAILDTVHEADFCFGLFTDELKAKEVFDQSIVILLADHGQITLMHKGVDVGQILIDGGFVAGDIDIIRSVGTLAWVYLADDQRADEFEDFLQGFTMYHSIQRKFVNPFIVINQSEMDSGVDDMVGNFGEDGIGGNKRGELYSEWCIDQPVPDNSKTDWPDLWVFTRDRFNLRLGDWPFVDHPYEDENRLFVASHGSTNSTWIPLAIHGPGINPGVYRERVTLADIVPTLYQFLGVPLPLHTDGRVIGSILASPVG